MASSANNSQPSSPTSNGNPQNHQQPQQQPQDDISPLECVPAAIFVTIPPETDLLALFPAPTTREDRQRAVLSVVNSHQAQVRTNLKTLIESDFHRIIRNAEAAEATFTYPNAPLYDPATDPGWRADIAKMLANMSAPDDPAKDYDMTEVPCPDFSGYPFYNTPREKASLDLMVAISNASANLFGFDKHVHSMREAVLRDDPEKEITKESDMDITVEMDKEAE